MSKENFEKVAKRELESLNTMIDFKIIRGFPYVKESRRHKFLTAELSRLQSLKPKVNYGSSFGWFSKSMSFVSTYVL